MTEIVAGCERTWRVRLFHATAEDMAYSRGLRVEGGRDSEFESDALEELKEVAKMMEMSV